MKVSVALRILDYPRSTFTTLLDNGSLGFLASAKRADYSWDLSFEDLLALGAYIRLRDMGITAGLAAHAIENGRARITAAAANPEGKAELVLGVTRTANDIVGFIGEALEEEDESDPVVVQTTVLLTPLARYLRAKAGPSAA